LLHLHSKLTRAAAPSAPGWDTLRPMRASRLPLLLLLAACPANPGDDTTTATATDPAASSGGDASSGTDAAPTTGGAPTSGDTTAAPESTGEATDPGTDTSADTGTDTDTDPFAPLVLEQTFEGGIANGWARVERWRDPNPAFIQEDRFDLDMRAHQTGQRLEFFGSDPVPHSSVLLLYYAPGWDAGGVPVLLAHGANDQADRAWANPGESGDFGCGQSECPDTGLMQDLAAQGRPVFAISHPHSQGDNFFWSEQIRDAIKIVRGRTGAAQVDLIGWSKGVMSSRMYVSSLTRDWGTPYQGDVRKLVLLGGPNLGFDYIFRYGTAHNGGIYADFGGKIHAPGPHDELLILGLWQDRGEYAIFKSAKGDPWRGQLQMLARWDDVYPLTGVANNGFMQWVVGDSESTYYGEGEAKGIYARGKGIDYAIDQGSIVADMVAAGVPAEIETYLLCGDLDLDDDTKLIPGIPNEIAGPSDGVVFLDSCAAPDGIGQLADVGVLENVNHLQLGWHPEAVAQIAVWLE
jgi:hypothetical protein